MNAERWTITRSTKFRITVLAARSAAIEGLEALGEPVKGAEQTGIHWLKKLECIDEFQEASEKLETDQSNPMKLPRAKNSRGFIPNLYLLRCGAWTGVYATNFETLCCLGMTAVEGQKELKELLEAFK